jgi:hypothetical protein
MVKKQKARLLFRWAFCFTLGIDYFPLPTIITPHRLTERKHSICGIVQFVAGSRVPWAKQQPLNLLGQLGENFRLVGLFPTEISIGTRSPAKMSIGGGCLENGLLEPEHINDSLGL